MPHDKVILLGDYFDAYNDTVDEAVNTAKWLRDYVVPNDKIVALIGNHDSSYLWQNNQYFRCSGFSQLKNTAINGVLEPKHKTKFKLFYVEQKFLLSHAGFTNELWKQYSAFFEDTFNTKLEYVEYVLNKMAEEAVIAANDGKDHQLLAAGWDRGGFARYGGINWVDWRNFSPIKGVNQIVGHSIHKVPQILVQKEGGGYCKKDIIEHYQTQQIINVKQGILSTSYGLDTASNHYMVIEDGEVQIYDLHTGINLRELDKYFINPSEMNTLS